MDAVVMSGGRGSRLNVSGEKPLVDVCGRPMVDRVIDALSGASVETIRATVSPWTPATTAHLCDTDDVAVIETAGAGYVADLRSVLAETGTPIVTVTADLPLLTSAHVDRMLTDSRGSTGSVTVCVPVSLPRRLGCRVETTIVRQARLLTPSGLNVVGDRAPERVLVSTADKLAVNVNRRQDLRVAEQLCD